MKTAMSSKPFRLQVLSLLFLTLLPVAAMANTEHCGTINSETWGAGTHYVTCSVTVADNQVLTIQPGAVVKFAFHTGLTVLGKLKASGTGAGDSIVFTSRDDDTFGKIKARL